MKPNITIKDYKKLLMHVADRFIEFRIIYNHSKLTHHKKFQEFFELNAKFISALYRREFNDGDIKKLKVISEFWDSVQSNFCYDKILNPSILEGREKYLYDELNKIILTVKRHPDFVNKIIDLRRDFHHLFWLRIADIINAVTPEQFLQKIEAANDYLLKFKKERKFKGYEKESLSTLLDDDALSISPFCEALSFYPELLKPGVYYVYPDITEMPAKATLAITCLFSADKEDIQTAFEEYPYQFEKFRNYFHMETNDFSEPVEIERLRPLLQRNVKKNKYISRAASIKPLLLALMCWEKIEFEKMDEINAIKSVFPNGYDKNSRAELVKKLRLVYDSMRKWDAHYKDQNLL